MDTTATMYCPKCAKQIEADSTFCRYCAANLSTQARVVGSKTAYNNGKALVVMGVLFIIVAQLWCSWLIFGRITTPTDHLIWSMTGTMLTVGFIGAMILPGLYLMHQHHTK